jgi:hypothetical protein
MRIVRRERRGNQRIRNDSTIEHADGRRVRPWRLDPRKEVAYPLGLILRRHRNEIGRILLCPPYFPDHVEKRGRCHQLLGFPEDKADGSIWEIDRVLPDREADEIRCCGQLKCGPNILIAQLPYPYFPPNTLVLWRKG